MKFMMTFCIKPEAKSRDEAIARFKATGGQPPKGGKLVGRWTSADFSGGFALLESDDTKALTGSRSCGATRSNLNSFPCSRMQISARFLPNIGNPGALKHLVSQNRSM